MGAQILIPQKKQESGLFQNILGTAGTIVGGIYGGPAGAAAGGAIGNTVGGAVSGGQNKDGAGDAIAKRLAGGLTSSGAESAGGAAVDNSESAIVKRATEAGALEQQMNQKEMTNQMDSPFARRMQTAQQDPRVGIQEGLDALTYLPQGHPLREEYTPALVRAQRMSGGIA
jgi:hypothetical protein